MDLQIETNNQKQDGLKYQENLEKQHQPNRKEKSCQSRNPIKKPQATQMNHYSEQTALFFCLTSESLVINQRIQRFLLQQKNSKKPNKPMKYLGSDQLYEIDEFFFPEESESLAEMFSSELRSQSISSDVITGFRTTQSVDLTIDTDSMVAEENSNGALQNNKAKRKNTKPKPHLSNLRRKKDEREVLKTLLEVAIQSSKFSLTQKQIKSLPKNIGQLTKNLLPFAKFAHMQFLLSKLGEQYFQKNPWLNEIRTKDGITVSDYDKLYKCEELKGPLEEFFAQKILYRELMTSRTIPVYKVLYMYFLEIFETNFNKKEFKGISVTKVSSEKGKSTKLNKSIRKN